jgi:hypothetical protein
MSSHPPSSDFGATDPPIPLRHSDCGLWNGPGRNAHPQITLIAQILILESKIFDYEDEDDWVDLRCCLLSKFGVGC